MEQPKPIRDMLGLLNDHAHYWRWTRVGLAKGAYVFAGFRDEMARLVVKRAAHQPWEVLDPAPGRFTDIYAWLAREEEMDKQAREDKDL